MVTVVLIAALAVFACRPDGGLAPLAAIAVVIVARVLPRVLRDGAIAAVAFTLVGCAVAAVLGVSSLDFAVVAMSIGVGMLDRNANHDRIALAVAAVALIRASGDAPSAPFIAALAVAVAAGAPVLAAGAVIDMTNGPPRPAPRLALAVAALAVPLFVVLPRFKSPDPSAFTGFSTDVHLGDEPAILDDPSTVLTVALAERPPAALYLRGAVFERFDGRAWSTRRPAEPADPPHGDDPAAITAVVASLPVDQGVVFTLGNTVSIDPDGPLRVDPAGAWRLDGGPRAARWTLRAVPPFGPGAVAPGAPPDRADRELPPLDPQIAALAAAWTADATDAASIVEALRAHLAGFTYTHAAAVPGDPDPLLGFLTTRKAGHCQYFASALAVLAREEGLPARVVTGFRGTTWDDDDGALVIRASDAHAWVEVWLGDRWVTVDATPGTELVDASPPNVVDQLSEMWRGTVDLFGPDDQLALLVGAKDAVLGPLGVGAAAFMALLALARAIARTSTDETAVRHELIAARDRLRTVGWRIPASLPPVAAARWLRERLGDEAAPFERLAWLHYRIQYDGADERPLIAEARTLRRAVDAIRGATAFDDAESGP